MASTFPPKILWWFNKVLNTHRFLLYQMDSKDHRAMNEFWNIEYNSDIHSCLRKEKCYECSKMDKSLLTIRNRGSNKHLKLILFWMDFLLNYYYFFFFKHVLMSLNRFFWDLYKTFQATEIRVGEDALKISATCVESLWRTIAVCPSLTRHWKGWLLCKSISNTSCVVSFKGAYMGGSGTLYTEYVHIGTMYRTNNPYEYIDGI